MQCPRFPQLTFIVTMTIYHYRSFCYHEIVVDKYYNGIWLQSVWSVGWAGRYLGAKWLLLWGKLARGWNDWAYWLGGWTCKGAKWLVSTPECQEMLLTYFYRKSAAMHVTFISGSSDHLFSFQVCSSKIQLRTAMPHTEKRGSPWGATWLHERKLNFAGCNFKAFRNLVSNASEVSHVQGWLRHFALAIRLKVTNKALTWQDIPESILVPVFWFPSDFASVCCFHLT